jgi:hypothetical protein
MTQETNSPPPTEQRRLPFHEAVTEEATLFAKHLMYTVPELEGVAIVFSYSRPSDNIPFAVVMGHNEGLKTPIEVVHMSQQLWKTINAVTQNGFMYIKQLDAHMAEKAKELQALRNEIDAARQERESLKSPPVDTGGS